VLPDPALLLPFYWQFSRDPKERYRFEMMRFGRHVVDHLGPQQTLITGATALRVELTADGSAVRAVAFAAPDGTVHEIETSAVVLATGGIENARLMLASAETDPRVLGEGSDHVGRYLMDHLRGRVGTFDVKKAWPMRRVMGRHTAQDSMFSAGMRLSPDLQRSEHLLNASVWFKEHPAADDPWQAMRHFARGVGSRGKHLKNLVKGAGLLVRGMRDYLQRGIATNRKLDELEVLVMIEQVPDPDSRVTLSDVRDQFGQRLPRVEWRSHPDEAATVRRVAHLYASEIARMGFPAPQLEPWVEAGDPLPDTWVDVAHPTGTTRMSAGPEDGVVDTYGQVHGVAGLYCAGSSVFPTAGHCNPTQMIVALSVRTADAVRDIPVRSSYAVEEAAASDPVA